MISEQTILLISLSLIYITLIAHYQINRIVKLMWSILQIETGNRTLKSRTWQAKTIGTIDRVLFLLSFLLETPEFIGLWLGIKTVSQYKRWSDDEPGRATFNIFLTGNGLSILYAAAGYGFIYLGKKVDFEPLFSINTISIILILLGPFILSEIMYRVLKNDERDATPD